MRTVLGLLIALLVCAGASAQSTTVSGTVTDTASQTWNSGTISFKFVPAPNYNGPYVWTGGAFDPNHVITASMNSSGAYSGASVPSNSAITPTGTTWSVTVCPQATSPCFVTSATIGGATQTLNVTPTAIQVAPGANVAVYATSEVVGASIGAQIYLIGTGLETYNGSTWSSSGGGGGSFSALTSGTNTTASMVVGTGASLAASGSGTITATAAPFSGITSGANTNTGLFSLSRTGTYTNTARNPNFDMLLDSCNPSGLYSTLHSAAGFQTDGIASCVAQQSGATAIQSNALAGYITTNQTSSGGTVADAIAVYGQCNSLTSGGGCWGVNGGATDGWPGSGVASRLEGAEFDCWVSNASSTCFGVQATGNIIGQPTKSTGGFGNMPAFLVSEPSGGVWTSGFACAEAATDNGTTNGDCLDIGPAATSGTKVSQSIVFHALNAGSVQSIYMTVGPSSSGPSPLFVPISSGTGNSIAVIAPAHGSTSGMAPNNLLSSGHATLSSGTVTVTFTNAYTSAPECTANGHTTANALLVTPSTGGLTITSSSGSDSQVVSWICMPAGN